MHDHELFRTRSSGEIISATFAFIRAHFRPLALAMLTVAVPVMVVAALLEAWSAALPEGVGRNLILLLTSVAPMVAVMSVSFAAVGARQADDAAEGLDHRAIVTRTAGLVAPILGVLFGWVLLLIVPVLLLGMIIAMGNAAMTAMAAVTAVILFVTFLPELSLVYAARALDEPGFLPALSRSHRLVRGRRWHAWLAVFVISVICLCVVFALMLPPMVFEMTMLLGLAPDSVLVLMGAKLLGQIPAFGYVIYLVGLAYLYADLVERSEAPGLALQVEQIGQAVEGDEDTARG